MALATRFGATVRPIDTILVVGGILIVAICWLLMTWHFGMLPTSAFPADDFVWLDGAWRIFGGQASSNDFYNPLGFFYYWALAFAMKLFGPTALSLVWTQLAFNVLLSIWMWLAIREKSPRFVVIPYIVAITVFLFSGKVYGHTYLDLGPAAYYNKIGVVLLSIVFIQSLCPRTLEKGLSHLQSLSIGLAISLMFAIKISFFIMAVPILFAGTLLVFWKDVRRAAIQLTIVFIVIVVTIAGLFLLTGTSLVAYVSDIALAWEARDLLSIGNLSGAFTTSKFYLYAVIVAVIFVLLLPAPTDQLFVTLGFILILGIVTIALEKLSSSQRYDPLFMLSIVTCQIARGLNGKSLVLQASRPSIFQTNAWRLLLGGLFTLSLLMTIVPYGFAEIRGRTMFVKEIWSRDSLNTVATPSMKGWSHIGRAGKGTLDVRDVRYVLSLRSGIQALRKIAGPRDTVFVLDFSNPFPFMLGLPSTVGGSGWFHFGTNMKLSMIKGGIGVLNDACLVLYPYKPYSAVSRNNLYRVTKGILQREYRVSFKDNDWVIFRRLTGCFEPDEMSGN